MKLIDYFTLRHLLVSLSGVLATFATEAQIATDGTVGPAYPTYFNGPDYVIGARLGTQVGANLFHSFSTFSIHTGESATFTGPTGLQNVISRVTGGELSTIDGLLRSEIAGASFFFINPAGVIFGANAQVDVPAAFHVSTADEVRLADGGVFSAANPGISTLSAAVPTAFGFLGPNRGRIGIEGSRLTFAPGSRVTVSAGEIAIREGSLVVEGGDVSLTALGEITGAVPVNEAFAGTARGALTIENAELDSTHPTLNVSGDGGGGLWLRAGEVLLQNAWLSADNHGARDATRGIDINAESLTAEHSWVTNDVYASGTGGDTTVTVKGTLSLLNGGVIGAGTISTANAGNITVTARNLLIDSQGFTGWNTGIFSSTTNVGDAGDVTITAGNLFMDGQGAAIFSDTYEGTGAGGNVTVTVADSLDMRNGSIIRADTRGAGDAGNVVLSAGNLQINRQGSSGVTGISSRAYPDSTGAGGNIFVTVSNTLSLLNGGAIGTSTHSTAAAGDITITADKLLIDMQGAERFTGISSNAAEGTGAAGNIHVTVADALSLLNGGAIDASTWTSGNAGNIKIAAGNMLIDNLGNITSSANTGSSGKGGNIDVAVTGSLSLLNGGQIGTNTWTDSDAGEITVVARNLLIDGQEAEFATGIISSVQEGAGAGGRVTVKVADTLSLFHGGTIDTNTYAAGNAGEMTITASNILIDRQGSKFATGIFSSAQSGSTGATGHLTVNADTLRLLNGGAISTESFAIRPAGTDSPTNDDLPNIRIAARELELGNGSRISSAAVGNTPTGAIQLQIGERLTLDHATISTEANEGDGGPITIDGGDLLLHDSQITTSVLGERGNGGDITLTPRTLVFDGGFVQANTTAANAKGGNIRIDTQTLLSPADQELRIGGQERETFQPSVNVIQAAAPQGESGTLNVTAPNLNLSSALAGMSNRYSDLSAAQRDPCARRRGQKPSTLAAAGRGGIPADNRAEVTVSLAGGDWTLPHELNAAATTSHESLALNDREECRL